jgi:hypothetical protein
LETINPSMLSCLPLRAAWRASAKGETEVSSRHLNDFLSNNEITCGLKVDAILLKGGPRRRVRALLRSEEGEQFFFKAVATKNEYRFFSNAERLINLVSKRGIQIVRPKLAIRAPGLVGLMMPYHDFMVSGLKDLDPASAAAAIAHLNSSGEYLRSIVGYTAQQRRSAFFPNIVRRYAMSHSFLRSERDLRNRTLRVLWKYRSLQRSTPKTFCHGDASRRNVYCYNGQVFFIDFENYFFSEPGIDLAQIYARSKHSLDEICDRYVEAFDDPVSLPHVRLAVIYGYFLRKLKRASRGLHNEQFLAALNRLEQELETDVRLGSSRPIVSSSSLTRDNARDPV